MSNKGGRVSPDYLADIAPEYAIVMLSNQKVDEVNGQDSQGKIDAPERVSILLKTDANA